MPSERAEVTRDEKRECPFPDCDWFDMYDPGLEDDERGSEHRATMHYEKEHAGRVRLLVTIEVEQLLGARSPSDARVHAMERFDRRGHDVAFVRSEVIEEADDHSKLENQPERPTAQEDSHAH